MSEHTVGRCGDSAPTFIGGPPELCRLPAGHAGWHRSDQGGEWNDPRPAPAGDGPRTDTAERLAEALSEWLIDAAVDFWPDTRDVAERYLVPVVADLAREQAAEELEAAAKMETVTGFRAYIRRRTALLRSQR